MTRRSETAQDGKTPAIITAVVFGLAAFLLWTKSCHPQEIPEPAPVQEVDEAPLDRKINPETRAFIERALLPPPPEAEPDPLHLLALTMWLEARGEGARGMRAVGHVIWNRVSAPHFPDDVPGVVLQPRQFSVWNSRPRDPREAQGADLRAWKQALVLAQDIMSGRDRDLTEGALFFHEQSISPNWATDASPTTEVGAHVFYASLNGS